MTEENKQIQADVNDVINTLSQQIAQLSADNAMLRSVVKQYQDKYNETENAE